jgi:DNA polymerase-3 subunit delta'
MLTGCGSCEDCRAAAADAHPDLHLIYRQLNREHPDSAVRKRKAIDLSVDVLRHFVIDRVGLTPMRGRYKVFIVREAERLTIAAQNALLKTLEEPPGATLIVLLAPSPGELLATTQSRSQTVRFDPLPAGFVREQLAARRAEISAEQLEWYATMAQGSIGRALQMVEDDLYTVDGHVVELLAQRGDGPKYLASKPWEELAGELADRERQRDGEISDTEATRRGLRAVMALAATWYGDVVRSAAGGGGSSGALHGGRGETLRWSAERMSLSGASAAVRRIAEAERQIDLNVNTQLVVETLLNDLGRMNRGEHVAV